MQNMQAQSPNAQNTRPVSKKFRVRKTSIKMFKQNLNPKSARAPSPAQILSQPDDNFKVML